MFKKDLLKKLAVLAMMGVMSLSLVACGDKDTDGDKGSDKKETTEATTEAGPVIQEGSEELNGLYYVVPEGFTKDASSTSTQVTYMHNDGIAFVIAVDNANTATESAAIDAFDAQIKQVFGTQVTYSTVSYNGYTATEWDTDAPDGSYEGRSLVICDGSLLVYLEYVTYVGGLDAYDELVESLAY